MPAGSRQDNAIHRAFQGQGLYPRLRGFIDEQRVGDLVVNNTTHAAVVRGRRATRREFATPIENLVLVRRPLRFLRTQASRGLRPTLGALRLVARSLTTRRRGAAPAGAWTLEEITSFDERVDAFFEEAGSAFDFITVRDHEYLNWRYCDPRGGRFAVTQAIEDGHVVGFVVTKVEGAAGRLVDLLSLPGRLDVASSLLDAALEELSRTNVITAWLPAVHPYRGLLDDRGFLTRRSEGIVLDSLDESNGVGDLSTDASLRVHFTLGDLDAV